MNNRDYLLMRLQGGLGILYLLKCIIDEAGQMDFTGSREIITAIDGCKEEYDIEVTKPGDIMEIRLGRTSAPDGEIWITFRDSEAPPIISSIEILDAFRRWKASPGVKANYQTIASMDSKDKASSYAIEYTITPQPLQQ